MEGKLVYTISEVANKFNVNQSLIRYWENEFPQYIKPKRNARGVRFYSKKDIENIEKIYILIKGKKFTHEGAKEVLKSKTFDKVIKEQTKEEPESKPVVNDMHGDGFLKYNHRKVYEKLLSIRKIAQQLIDE